VNIGSDMSLAGGEVSPLHQKGIFIDHWPDAAGGKGPLSGIRVAVKNNIDVAGAETTLGLHATGTPARDDAACVRILKQAGASIIGTTNLAPFALGVDTDSLILGRCPNPAFPDLISGGSSGGSAAAVAAGLADFALGTDTGGSVRGPAACCGVYGLKPSRDQIPFQGIAPLAPSLDHVGFIARDLAALDLALQVFGAAPSRIERTWIVGIPQTGPHFDIENALRPAWDAAVGHLNACARLETIALPAGSRAQAAILGFEAARSTAPRRADLDPDHPVARRLREMSGISDSDYAAARGQQTAITSDMERLLSSVDVIVHPVFPVSVPKREERFDAAVLTRFTCLANLTGLPALSMPAGMDSAGSPFNIQITGRKGDDLNVLAFARTVTAKIEEIAANDT